MRVSSAFVPSVLRSGSGRLVAALTIAVTCGAGAVAWAQGPTGNDDEHFEVASVRRNRSNSDARGLRIGGSDRVSLPNMPLRQLIGFAYGKRPFEVVGGPRWIEDYRYDITAKASGPIGTRETLPMLRSLLKERFRLSVRQDTRRRPVYVLVIAAAGTAAAAIRPSTVECPAPAPRRTSEPVLETKEMREAPLCGIRGSGSPAQAEVAVQYGAQTMSQLAENLSFRVGRPVRDGTGLLGRFDFALTFLGTQQPPETATPSDAPQTAPNIFVALREQLGLTLKSDTADVDVLVVDHVEPPDEN
jgi:uncharacterized protein (TIGR03435 family)